jgi:hypothetical protein
MPASVLQFVHESAYRVIVSNGELVRVTSHDRTSFWKLYRSRLIVGWLSSVSTGRWGRAYSA